MMMTDPAHPQAARLLSIVVPVLNEQDGLTPFVAALSTALDGCRIQIEVLFVDDGSTDATLEQLRQLARQDARVRYLSLSRNFGKEAALTAGLLHARGDAVVPMDVDLQDPPHLIRDFLRLWEDQGYDMVYGVRESRSEDTRLKRSSAGWFYRFFNRIADAPIPAEAGDFRLLDRRVVEALRRLPERNRFMKGLYAWAGFRSVGVTYQRPARTTGHSKFNYWKLWNFALDGLFSFSTLPLRVWSYIGGFTALLAFVYLVIIIGKVLLLGRDVAGYASLMSTVLFLGGMQLLSIGILGEYVGRLFIESKGRPLYLVAEDSDAMQRPTDERKGWSDNG